MQMLHFVALRCMSFFHTYASNVNRFVGMLALYEIPHPIFSAVSRDESTLFKYKRRSFTRNRRRHITEPLGILLGPALRRMAKNPI